MQLGTQEQKNQIAADVLGVTIPFLKAFMNTNVNTMPVIYLFILGKVKDLRETFAIPAEYRDEDVVVKYGLTKDLRRRSMEHEKMYGKMTNVQMSLKYHVYIDQFYLSEAEMDVERCFKSAHWHLNHTKFTEMAVVPEHMLNSIVHNEFKRLGQSYAGRLQDIQTQLQNEQKLNEQLRKQLDAQEEYHKQMLQQMERTYTEMERLYKDTLKNKDQTIDLYKLIVEKKLLD